jgi:peptide/nickel transport system substrate-binding protein
MQSGAFMVFEPNPHWWGQKPHFKRVTLKTIENTATLEANLRSGDVDFISGVLGSVDGPGAGHVQRADDAAEVSLRVSLGPGLRAHRQQPQQSAPCKDKRVRQALLLGIDRETLVKQLVDGKFPVAHSWVNPMDAGYDPNVTKYPL